MLFAYQCHDTCAILSTHGLSGFLGWTMQLLLQVQHFDDHVRYEPKQPNVMRLQGAVAFPLTATLL